MTTATARAAQLMSFNEQGRQASITTIRNRADWQRCYRDAREQAGRFGTVLLLAASVAPLTGKLVSVAATPSILR